MRRERFQHPVVAAAMERRVRRLGWVVVVVLGVLVGRLWQLQIVEGLHYRQVAQRQSSRLRVLLPPRGLVLDRHGRVLVDNQPGYRLRFYPDRATDPEATLAFLRRTLTVPPVDLAERLHRALRRRPYRPETLVERIGRDDLARIAALGYEHPELEVEAVPLRRYPYRATAAHVVGYLGEITDKELARRADPRYAPGDIVGKAGVERVYDRWLFGTKGWERHRVDARGRMRALIARHPPRPGWDLELTLDLELQRVAEAALGGRRGAIVALDPDDGEILAAVSHPAYDPKLFIGGISRRAWERLRDDPDAPLLYRVTHGLYPPGSTFKPIVALAALAEGVVTPQERIPCPGHYRLGRRLFRCWKPGGHGRVDLRRALVESCDVYFYELGRRLGIERLTAWARRFGLGLRTGVDLVSEKAGLVPDPVWFRRTRGQRWQVGDTVVTAIGQGSLLVTPLQMAVLYAAIANGGRRVVPHLWHGFRTYDRPGPEARPRIGAPQAVTVPPAALAVVQAALEGVVASPHGTGVRARIPGIRVAGKTGTAQVVRQDQRGLELDERLRDHAWFVAYAPAEAPRIVVAVIVENGEHGGATAAPVARQVIEAYLRRRGAGRG